MTSSALLLSASIYFGILFLIASAVNRQRVQINRFISPATVYALSLAVYCTAWTFFGSVGNASKSAIGFLPVYLGPTVFMPVIVLVWFKILRISKEYRITNIADFLAVRYGHSRLLGVLVTLFFVCGITPYIALQLKAIGLCLASFSTANNSAQNSVNNSVFYFSIILIIFSILYGARNIDASEKHKGLIAAISFESIVKLLAILVVGVYVCFFIFSSPFEIFLKYDNAVSSGTAVPLLSDNFNSASWMLIMLISALSMILLPRQFQVAIVENTNENHLKKAVWMFPLYLLLINLFVIPIALAGLLTFGTNVDPDTFVLAFPIHNHNLWVSLLVFWGGLSAATGMVIVETIALSTMISNNLVIPIFISRQIGQDEKATTLKKFIVYSRRVAITLIIIGAYYFEETVAGKTPLLSIGLLSFAAVSQLAPALLFGLYWRSANKKAAISSITVGFVLWFFTLILPTFSGASPMVDTILRDGLFGLEWLRPTSLLYFTDFDSLSHGIFWSLLANLLTFIGVSLYTTRDASEVIQAEAFVNIQARSGNQFETLHNNEIPFKEILYIFKVFFGEDRGSQMIHNYLLKHNLAYSEKAIAPGTMVNYVERVLSGAIGPISTKMIIGSLADQQPISMGEVLDILKENQQTMQLNKELKKKSIELKKVTEALQFANEQLTKLDEQKDEFLYTVTHELRTPLTSIRALSEVIYDNPDLDDQQREKYLGVIIKETERMTLLISEVLNLEKYDSGKQKLYLESIDLVELIDQLEQSFLTILSNKQLSLTKIVPNNMFLVRVDKERINQVFYNLISNAIKYAKSNITIRLSDNYNEVIVSIIDDGPGIPEDQKELVFDKFYQVKNKKLQKPDGSGLGLAISKKIVELHEKKIWIENVMPNGTNFSFNLELI